MYFNILGRKRFSLSLENLKNQHSLPNFYSFDVSCMLCLRHSSSSTTEAPIRRSGWNKSFKNQADLKNSWYTFLGRSFTTWLTDGSSDVAVPHSWDLLAEFMEQVFPEQTKFFISWHSLKKKKYITLIIGNFVRKVQSYLKHKTMYNIKNAFLLTLLLCYKILSVVDT